MGRFKSGALFLGLLIGGGLFAAEQVPGEFIVKYRSASASFSAKRLGKGAKRLSERGRIFLVRDSQTSLSKLAADPAIERVEPNYILRASFGSRKKKRPHPSPYPPFVPVPPRQAPTPAEPDPVPAPTPDEDVLLANDQHFSKQWALRNTQGYDAKVAKAWNAGFTGSEHIVVAVLDSGIDYNHNDLDSNMWSKSVNGQNIHGYNAIQDSFNPMDDHNHGTHVAGVIGAVTNNGRGIAGMNWKVQLMALKFLNSEGNGTTADAIESLDWARENGAQVMNMSWGGGAHSQLLLEALGRAEAAGIVLVAAAGNESNNNDLAPTYPANYEIPSLISVAASDSGDRLAWFSNFGATSVDILAPGVSILSTVTNNNYANMNGTSMAAPHVSGAAALLLSKHPTLTPLEVKQKLLQSVDAAPLASGKVASGGRLNVFKALQ
jgi:subtilisin family serine protease